MHIQLSLSFATAVLSIVPYTFAYVYSTQSICKTAYATTSPASVKSTSIAITIPITFVSRYTSTPTVIVSPKPKSTTVTTTSTVTTVHIKGTISTVYSTTTSTSTDFTTTTQTITGGTTTATAGTSTIPTVAGFTPLASGTDYVARKRSLPLIDKERVAERAAATPNCQLPPPSSPHSFSPAVYPTAVTCGYLVEAITTTVKTIPATTTTTKTLAPSTITGTSTAYTTVSIISGVPSSTITSIISATTTITTSTVTASITTTVTVAAPSATFYAACAANNLIDRANSDPETGPGGITLVAYTNFLDNMTSTSDTSAYDCCVSCQTASGCEGYAFMAAAGCFYFTNSDTCDGSDFGDIQFASSPVVAPGAGYTIGDGPCGQYGDEDKPAGGW